MRRLICKFLLKYHTDVKCQSHLVVEESQSDPSTTVIDIDLMEDESRSDPSTTVIDIDLMEDESRSDPSITVIYIYLMVDECQSDPRRAAIDICKVWQWWRNFQTKQKL